MPRPKLPPDPRYPWPAEPRVATCPSCGRPVVIARSFGRDVVLEREPRRDRFGDYGVDHELLERCRPPSPF